MEEGYFKLYRKILESQVFAHPIALKIWIWCLAKASRKKRYITIKIGRGTTTVALEPGQFVFGRFTAEEQLNIDGSTIYKWMQKFASPEFDMILIQSNNQYSVITICNWIDYQGEDNEEVTAEEQPCNNQVTAEEQPCNTNKNVDNVKNVKNDIGENKYIEGENQNFSTESEIQKKAKEYWQKWKDYKKVELGFEYKSPISEDSAKRFLLKIANNNLDEVINIIDFTISQGYRGFVKPNNSNNGKSNRQEQGVTPEQLRNAIIKGFSINT